MRKTFARVLVSLASATVVAQSLLACQADIVGDHATSTEARPEQGAAGGAPPVSDTCRADVGEPGPTYLRRLTNQEYASTVRDLLGLEAAIASLPRDLTLHGFDNNAEAISLSTAHLEGYRALAESVATQLVASQSLRAALVGCDPSGAEALPCLESFVRRFGLRLLRRPLLEQEVSELLALATAAPASAAPWNAVSLVIEALLQTPSFLFRVELGQAEAVRPGVLPLTPHELATRLSYLLWGTTPDPHLLELAASGALASAEGVEAQALAMLDDPSKASPTIWSFTGQWLRIGNLATAVRPPLDFPDFDETLRAAMSEETRRVVEEHTTRPGVPLLNLLDTTTTFVDSSLAKLYGVTAPAANTWAQLTLPAAQERRGILSHASILTLTANTHATTPITRGKYIRQVLLCDELPPPPPEAPTLSDASMALSERERLAEHRSNPACSGCHSLLEPLGFGLAHFDAIGARRVTDVTGQAIDSRGEISGLADAAFNGAAELAQRLRREPRVGRCLSTHLVRFAFGRKETDSDRCTIEQLGEVLQQGGDFRALLRALVRSDGFRYRRSADSSPGSRP
jgi:hypothetical protein